ncbi:NMS protein, partial [Tachuris rubrigastra]|nr:NMS protein [Tachuris rubrigastra]
PAMPSPSPALPLLLAACCLCALPRGSGTSRHREAGAERGNTAEPQNIERTTLLMSNLYFLKQLALCFSQWMEMSNEPQISSSVLDLCYSIFNSLHKNE